jgi:hypothetical protein
MVILTEKCYRKEHIFLLFNINLLRFAWSVCWRIYIYIKIENLESP